MNCELCALDTSADPVMWKCAGCPRMFHAACVGVTVQRGSLRKKDKKVVDVNAYVLPCCDSCQESIQSRLEFKRLEDQQKLLVDQLNANTEVIHKFTLQQEKPKVVHEALDGMEILLTSIKNELSEVNKSSSLSGSVIAIKNHITSALNTAMLATKEDIYADLKSMTIDCTNNLANIEKDICQINQLYIDTVATCSTNTNQFMGVDILEELKSLSAKLTVPEKSVPPSPLIDQCPSLEDEMAIDNSKKSNDVIIIDDSTKSGPNQESTNNQEPTGSWRIAGKNKVWCGDWSEDDARNRLNHQQVPQISRKNNNKYNNNSNYSSNHRINRITNSNHYNNRSNNKNNRHNKNNNNHIYNNNLNNYNNNSNYNNNYNNNNRYNNRNQGRNQSRTRIDNHGSYRNRCHDPSTLPSDKVLLAAAKVQFSRPPLRPPTPYCPTIGFQRGEVLNPYPANDNSPVNTNRNSTPPMANNCPCQCFCQQRRTH